MNTVTFTNKTSIATGDVALFEVGCEGPKPTMGEPWGVVGVGAVCEPAGAVLGSLRPVHGRVSGMKARCCLDLDVRREQPMHALRLAVGGGPRACACFKIYSVVHVVACPDTTAGLLPRYS
jgi:hypothetical protein